MRHFSLFIYCFWFICLLGCGANATAAEAKAETAVENSVTTGITPEVALLQATPTPVALANQPVDRVTPSAGQSRGYQTTPDELVLISQKAADGIEPYASAVDGVLNWADRKWKYNFKKQETCKNADKPDWLDEEGGVPKLYARALAYHLTGDSAYAQVVEEILQEMMSDVERIDLDEQQCRLNFGWGTPEIVAAADLIEGYWLDHTCTGPTTTLYEDTTIGSGQCKVLFQNWLVKNPYYLVSYTAEEAKSNWGAAATNTLAYIADYLWDRPDVRLIHRMPDIKRRGSYKEIQLTAQEAYARANQLMLDRMNGYGVELHSTNSCDYLAGVQQNKQWEPVKSQINENGIIPEDARREESCNVPQYNGEYQNYPQVHLGNNIQQCELMLRRGDASCYDNIDNSEVADYSYVDAKGITQTTHLYPGRGSIERAIKAIIIDSETEWKHDAALEIAYRYYYNHHTLPGFDKWLAELDRPSLCSQDACFGTLTHGFADDETPTLPPTVSPP